jgi:hypothetical protein
VARRLKIDYAPALVASSHARRGHRDGGGGGGGGGGLHGIVICNEYVKALLAAAASRVRGAVMGVGGSSEHTMLEMDSQIDSLGDDDEEEENTDVGDYERARQEQIDRNNDMLAKLGVGFAVGRDGSEEEDREGKGKGRSEGDKGDTGHTGGDNAATSQGEDLQASLDAKEVMHRWGEVSVGLLKWFSRAAAAGGSIDDLRNEQIARILQVLLVDLTGRKDHEEGADVGVGACDQMLAASASVRHVANKPSSFIDWLALAKDANTKVGSFKHLGACLLLVG